MSDKSIIIGEQNAVMIAAEKADEINQMAILTSANE